MWAVLPPLRRSDASRLAPHRFNFRTFFFDGACSDLWRPPAAPAAHALRAGGAEVVLLSRRGGWFFDFCFFVSALNCVSYGEPDVRPAGRPDGRVRGLARCGGRLRCGVIRVG